MAGDMNDVLNPGASKHDADFPYAPSDWSRELATAAAKSDGLKLGQDHWEAIGALQALFATQSRPNMRQLHDALEERFHAKGGLKYLYEAFPGGPVTQGCRFAGLQAPAGAADKSFGSVG